MIIVTGSVVARPESFALALEESRAHVTRSRQENGCISHEVLQDLDDPLRLVFFERWRDRAALNTHFAQPGSNEFLKALRSLVAEPPTLEMYNVDPVAPR